MNFYNADVADLHLAHCQKTVNSPKDFLKRLLTNYQQYFY
jgi:hypothetical protein